LNGGLLVPRFVNIQIGAVEMDIQPYRVWIAEQESFAECLAGDTLVSMQDGFKPIREIQEGDICKSWNADRQEYEFNAVLSANAFSCQREMVEVFFATSGERVQCTSSQKFLADGKWTAAKFLDGIDGNEAVKIASWDEPVYRLSVDGADAILVTESEIIAKI